MVDMLIIDTSEGCTFFKEIVDFILNNFFLFMIGGNIDLILH
jgi:hypothetical protein